MPAIGLDIGDGEVLCFAENLRAALGLPDKYGGQKGKLATQCLSNGTAALPDTAPPALPAVGHEEFGKRSVPCFPAFNDRQGGVAHDRPEEVGDAFRSDDGVEVI